MITDIQTVRALCPICYHSVSVPFFDGGVQPLATLGWPASEVEAKAMERFPHNFVQCPKCTHVWNRSFSYDAIPYENNPNRMYNSGGIWQGHLKETRDLVLSKLPENPTVVDIGCGEGHFVRGLSDACEGKGRFVGFDPNTAGETGRGVEFHASYFEPLKHMAEFEPDVIVIRHVLEHLLDPAVLLEQMAWGCSQLSKPVWLFAEMPCIDRVLDTNRLADFFYEHPSHFTSKSFLELMARAGEVVEFSHGYDGEVVYAMVKLHVSEAAVSNATVAKTFFKKSEASKSTIQAQLDDLAKSQATVAIWGGTGKAAAFIHQYNADVGRFPLVVDSDLGKVGTHVPGTGQEILFRDVLKEATTDIVIIPTQWRARDIVAEIEREEISVSQVLIEHQGQLIDFFRGDHPY